MNDAPYQDLLVCPKCHGDLVGRSAGVECVRCQANYPRTEGGPFDLRLATIKEVDLTVKVGPDEQSSEPRFGLLRRNPDAELDFEESVLPRHLSPEMASYIPKPANGECRCLDLGCGAGEYRSILEQAGYRWVGFDYQHKKAPMWADAHALPFADNTFDFVMSLAVLEHIKCPPVMLREVRRVLKPGCQYLGSVTYLMPFHDWASYFNMTHYGVWSAMQDAGLDTEFVCGDKQFLGIRAIAHGGLFTGLKRQWAHAMVAPVIWLHRLHWLRKRLRGKPRFDEDWQSLLNSGAFIYRASKPREASTAARAA